MIWIILFIVIYYFLWKVTKGDGSNSTSNCQTNNTNESIKRESKAMDVYKENVTILFKTFVESGTKYEVIPNVFSVDDLCKIYLSNAYSAKKDFNEKIVWIHDQV